MKDLVSDRRITVVASIGAFLVASAVLLSPGGSAPGIPILATLLVTTTAVLLLGRGAPAPSPAPVIQNVHAAPSLAGKGKATP